MKHAVLLCIVFFTVTYFICVCECESKEYTDQEILDRINRNGKCYNEDNMLFYPIRNTVLIDADSVVFEFIGSINHTLICCMFNGTRFMNSTIRKIKSCTQNTPRQIQKLHGVSCCKFYHRVTFRAGFHSEIMRDYYSDTVDTWSTLTSLTARITNEQIETATKKGAFTGQIDQVVYEGYFQLHYLNAAKGQEMSNTAPSKPGKSFIRRTWRLVNGLPDVHIDTETNIAVPGTMIVCSVGNATTPRVRLYPSLEPRVFSDQCYFHTMRIRSHEPRASQLKNSRATYPHFSLPQMATYVTARAWSTFPKCAFKLGHLDSVSVTVRCRTSVARSRAYMDAWSAKSVRMTLYNPSVVKNIKRNHHFYIDEIQLGFMFPKLTASPYILKIMIPPALHNILFLDEKKEATLLFHKNAPPGVYEVGTEVIPKGEINSHFIDDNDVIFRDTMSLSLHSVEPRVEPVATIHYVYEIVRCRASVDSNEFIPFLGWDIGNLDPAVRSKIMFQENRTAFVFVEMIDEKYQPFTFHCRLGSRPDNEKTLRHTFKISGKPHLRLKPLRMKYFLNDFVTCETDRKSYGEVVLRPVNLCKDKDRWCKRRIEDDLRNRINLDTFAFPKYLEEAEYKIQCEIRAYNTSNNYAKEMFTISYNGVRMALLPNKTRFNFNREISCIPFQVVDQEVYFEFPPEWAKFVKLTKRGTFYVSDVPNHGWMTFFCGLSNFERKFGKNFTIFIGDENFGRLETRNTKQKKGRSWEFCCYALFAGFLNNLILLYIAFAINFLIRMYEQKRACVRRFIEKYNIAAYDEATPGFFNDFLTFACEESWIRKAAEARHFNSTN